MAGSWINHSDRLCCENKKGWRAITAPRLQVTLLQWNYQGVKGNTEEYALHVATLTILSYVYKNSVGLCDCLLESTSEVRMRCIQLLTASHSVTCDSADLESST